jgi:hypothetical protein
VGGYPVRLIGNKRGLTFYVRPAPKGGSAEGEDYWQLCTAPCDEKIDPGLLQLAVAKLGGKKVASDQSIIVVRPSTIYGEYHSPNGLRAVGALMVVVGVFAIALSPIVAKNPPDLEGEHPNGLFDWGKLFMLAAGGGITAGIGLSFALSRDTVSFTVKPGIAPVVTRRNSASADSHRAVSLSGLTAAVRF